MPLRSSLLLLAALLAAALPCLGKTSEVSSSAFLSAFHVEVPASPADAWSGMTRIPQWWSPEHTYSGDAANLTLEATAGGCWCERWKGNSVEHARVIVAMPGALLRLQAALGPLQAMAVSGVLTFRLSATASGTAIDVAYRVRGTPDAGLDKIADAVDRVLGEQVARLAASLSAPRGEAAH
jgi:uncharacterized protein YndB with AHSA1/START domain